MRHLDKQNVARLKSIFIKINLFKPSVIKNTYITYAKFNLYSLSHNGYLLLEKYINELFHFNLFGSIIDIDIRVNYRILFNFMKDKYKKFYVYFDVFKNRVLSAFKLLKKNVEYNKYRIKRLRSDDNSVIKNKVFNNFYYDNNIA